MFCPTCHTLTKMLWGGMCPDCKLKSTYPQQENPPIGNEWGDVFNPHGYKLWETLRQQNRKEDEDQS